LKRAFEAGRFAGNGRPDDEIAVKFAPCARRDNFVRRFSRRDIIVFDRKDAGSI
jgi:hypothetical protein